MKIKKAPVCLVAISVFLFIFQPVNASIVNFDLDTKLLGNPTPSALPPWLTATFTDVIGGVELKMEATNLDSNQSVQKWWFNYEGTGAAIADLNFAYQASSGPNAKGINKGIDNQKVGGDGFFDIFISFFDEDFNPGEEVIYLISAATGSISSNDFKFGSVPSDRIDESFFTVARILDDPVNNNGPTVGASVPIPGAVWMLGSGLVGLVFLRRRMKT